MWTTEGPSIFKEAERGLILTSLRPKEPHGLRGQISSWNAGCEALLVEQEEY